jgi:hypothetical protein
MPHRRIAVPQHWVPPLYAGRLDAYQALDCDGCRAIGRDNAATLFPRLAAATIAKERV